MAKAIKIKNSSKKSVKDKKTPELVEETETASADTSSPDVEGVKKYLKETEDNAEKEAYSNIEKAKQKPVALDSEFSFSKTFTADPTFESNKLDQYKTTYFTEIADEQIPITDDDQGDFMKAMLYDTPVHMTQTMLGGKFQVECRALSVYESDLVFDAALKLAGITRKEPPTHLLPGYAQQIRVAMQIVKVNNIAEPYISVSPDRNNYEMQVDKLIEDVDKRLKDVNVARYGLFVRALNVFEHKLAKLNELAYTANFWNPVETD